MNPYLLTYLVGLVVTLVVAARWLPGDEGDASGAAMCALFWPVVVAVLTAVGAFYVLWRLARVGKEGEVNRINRLRLWLARAVCPAGWAITRDYTPEPLEEFQLHGHATVVEGIAAEKIMSGQIVVRGEDGLFRCAVPPDAPPGPRCRGIHR